MPIAHIRSVQISWSEQGVGPTVIYAHGLTSSRRNDDGFIDWHTIVEAGFRLIAYDARGHGLSEGSANPNDYEWSALGKDLIAFIKAVAPGEKVTVIGRSMGTAALVYAAIEAPELFEGMVFTATPTAWETRADKAAWYDDLANQVERDGARAYVDVVDAEPDLAVFADLPDHDLPPDIKEDVFPSVLRGLARSDFPEVSLVASIDIPLLILAWTNDPGHPVSSAQRMHELIDGSILSIAETPADLRTWGERIVAFLQCSS